MCWWLWGHSVLRVVMSKICSSRIGARAKLNLSMGEKGEDLEDQGRDLRDRKVFKKTKTLGAADPEKDVLTCIMWNILGLSVKYPAHKPFSLY